LMKDVFGNKIGKRTIECDLKETARVLYDMYIPHVYHLGPGRLRVESNRQFLDPDKTLIEQGVTTQTSIEFVPDFHSGVCGGGMTTRGSSDADAADAAKAARLSVPVTEMDVWAKGMRVVVAESGACGVVTDIYDYCLQVQLDGGGEQQTLLNEELRDKGLADAAVATALEPVETQPPPPPQCPASEMGHEELAKADHSTPGLRGAVITAITTLTGEEPIHMSTSGYQSKLKGILHAKTQEGKTFKIRVDGSIIWDAAAEEALLEGVPENFEYIAFTSQDGKEVWRGIAWRRSRATSATPAAAC
jgi:hypothetical protein